MGAEGLVIVGRIAGAHGVAGEFKVQPLTDYPERFVSMEELNLYKQNGSYLCRLDVQSVRYSSSKGQFIVKVAQIKGRDEAQTLSGAMIKVDPEKRVELDEDSYWIDDLIGLEVRNHDSGDVLGRIVDVVSTGGSDLYEVETLGGERKYVPAVSDFVRKIDIAGGYVEISLIEGLWD